MKTQGPKNNMLWLVWVTKDPRQHCPATSLSLFFRCCLEIVNLPTSIKHH